MSTNETGKSKKDKTTSIFSRKVDSTKVNLPVIKRWIEEEITAQIPDDDIAAGFIYELIAGEENPDINAIRAQTDDFLGPKESKIFCKKLWKHLLSAQGDKDGLPSELVELRRRVLEEQRANQAKLQESKLQDRNRGWYHRDRRARYGRRDSFQKRGQGRSYRDSRTSDDSSEIVNDTDAKHIDSKKTNYNRSERKESRDESEVYHSNGSERGPRDKTLL
ncbi:hypothetical protein CJJ07_000171 [Candidozyma auris]|nr:hypothetical protein CJJ07_000171 [[Candida] auris]QEL61013.1 hypothetical protein CJJ09_003149 [[Candida] auris]